MTATQTEQAVAGVHANTDADQYLTFMLAGEEYGVEILRVQGIQGWGKVTPIPNTPDYILGVINLRGAIVPIMDLRRRFELEEVPFGPTTVVIVVKVADGGTERTVGIVVDGVSEVYRLESDEVQPPPDFGGAARTEFVQGLSMVEEKMVILLDIDKLVDLSVVRAAAEQPNDH